MEDWLIGLGSGTAGLLLCGGVAWVFRVDRKLTAVCTTVDLLFREKNHHCGEQKEACKDRFETHCDADEEYRLTNDKRVSVVEADVKILMQK